MYWHNLKSHDKLVAPLTPGKPLSAFTDVVTATVSLSFDGAQSREKRRKVERAQSRIAHTAARPWFTTVLNFVSQLRYSGSLYT